MELLEKRLFYSNLIHLYGELLSPTQKEILEDYLLLDLSLSEIAENRSTSRAAVEDAIKKGMKKLLDFENKLQFENKKNIILQKTEVLKEKYGNCDEIKEIEEALK